MFSGGGTAGSVTPLLAVAEQLRKHELFFVGTYQGVERQLVTDLVYLPLLSGKLRRYFSIRNIIDPFIIILAFWQSWYYIMRYNPTVVVSAGGFVSVPLVWAAWWCNVPVVVHQQDVRLSLSTKLMKPFATVLTKAFAETPLSVEPIGNPVRDLSVTTNEIKLDSSVPTVLIMGGGTGAQFINDLVSTELCNQVNVIHITGEGKMIHTINHARYHPYTLLTNEFNEAIHKADLVVCRAGLGTLSELAELGKPTMIIPIPNSHQEDNAKIFTKHNAAVVLEQTTLTPERFTQEITNLLHDQTKLDQLGKNIIAVLPNGAKQRLVQLISRYG